jgi:CBS domain-containing protein
VQPDDSFALAAAKMKAGKFRSLLVVDEGKLLGILSQHDLEDYGNRLESISVKAAMTPRPVTVSS